MAETFSTVPRIRRNRFVAQPDTTVVPRWATPSTFAMLPDAREVGDVDVAVIGAPYDSGVSFRPGARFGPAHIRSASKLLRPFNPEAAAWPFITQQVADLGDIAFNPFHIEQAVTALESGFRATLERANRYLALGGDHTIALPSLRALHAVHGPIAVVHFDAHLDTWNTYFDTPILHGTPFRRASEEGLLDLEACLHIGTRGGLYGLSDMDDDRQLGFQTVRSIDFDRIGLAGVIEQLHHRVGQRPTYVSVDIDVLDPAFAPGTGTPEAGGISSRELLAVLRATHDLHLVGGDVVEVSPAYDHAEITGIAAAHVIYELLSAMAPREDLADLRTR